jgi:uncharacterized OsmC-like protein
MSVKEQVNVVDLKSTVEVVRDNPKLGQVSFSMKGTWDGGLRLNSQTGPLTQAGTPDMSRNGQFKLKSDEPTALLGSDTGVSPGEYVLQALAGCYMVTIAANAAVRDIVLEDVRLELEADFDLRGFLGIDTSIRSGSQGIRVNVAIDSPNATSEQLKDLVHAVEKRSPIRDTLANPVDVKTTLVTA